MSALDDARLFAEKAHYHLWGDGSDLGRGRDFAILSQTYSALAAAELCQLPEFTIAEATEPEAAAGDDYTRALREFADWLDAHPDAPRPDRLATGAYRYADSAAEVETAADVIGAKVASRDHNGKRHTRTEVRFGDSLIEYVVLHIGEAE